MVYTAPRHRKLPLHTTPVKEKEIIAFGERLSMLVEVMIEEPVIKGAIQRYVKGSLANVHVGALAQTLLDHTQVAENARAKRKQGSMRVLQKGGVIEVGAARRRLIQEAPWDVRPLQQRLKALLVRDKKRWALILDEFMAFTKEPYWQAHIHRCCNCVEDQC
jgi:hypothetical protein